MTHIVNKPGVGATINTIHCIQAVCSIADTYHRPVSKENTFIYNNLFVTATYGMNMLLICMWSTMFVILCLWSSSVHIDYEHEQALKIDIAFIKECVCVSCIFVYTEESSLA